MADKGAELQLYNNELVKCIEDLKIKRDEVTLQISREEDEKEKLIQEIRLLNDRLSRVEDSLARKYASRSEVDRAIKESENAYGKIVESSQTLLEVLRRDMATLSKRQPAPALKNY
eukprot:TRINITY_DN14308_c0_g1_i1.p3 TRINITY_DN14308_c0_g1~~TRINITY_DN14308_c0_g1_i1.p3  ORF type:complete len:116 (+),score=20.00 TRINITY_DN14308_c0_g1_i1:37-384(+)